MARPLSRTLNAQSDLGLAFGLVVLFFVALTLSSCNTVEGMGEDVSAAGGAMSDTADDVKDKM